MKLFSGPVTAGEISEPACVVSLDLAANGYVEEEFFAAGTACGYDAAGEASADGHWACAPSDDFAPYRSRVLVRRPPSAPPIAHRDELLAQAGAVTFLPVTAPA